MLEEWPTMIDESIIQTENEVADPVKRREMVSNDEKALKTVRID